MADPDIDQLKELVRQNIALAQDTNRILRSMRTSSRLKSLFWIIVFLASTGASVYAYYIFLEPRIEQIKNLYETTVVPLQGAGSNISHFFNSGNSSATTTR
jgi:hypothetical protein